jgi:hypothetical protein
VPLCANLLLTAATVAAVALFFFPPFLFPFSSLFYFRKLETSCHLCCWLLGRLLGKKTVFKKIIIGKKDFWITALTKRISHVHCMRSAFSFWLVRLVVVTHPQDFPFSPFKT